MDKAPRDPHHHNMSTENSEKPASPTPTFGIIPTDKYQLDTARKEIIFWEEGNPNCVVNLLTPKLKKAAMAIPGHLLGMYADTLRKKIKANSMDEQLRVSFWEEFMLASDNNQKMRVEAIYPRVCVREYFYKHFVDNPARFAYMLHPPAEYMLQMKSLLQLGLRRFEEILQMPLTNDKGVVNSKLVSEIVRIVMLVDNRVKGSVVQKIQLDQKSVNVNVSYEPPKKIEDIDKELKDVENEIKRLSTPEKQPIEDFLFNDTFPAAKDLESDAREYVEATATSIEAEAVATDEGESGD
jgi:hypothetical protein